MKAIDVVNEADRDRVKGEALFLRGLMYFELVELYAKPYSDGNAATNPGLQLITTPTIGNLTDSNYVARSTVQQTYDFVLMTLHRHNRFCRMIMAYMLTVLPQRLYYQECICKWRIMQKQEMKPTLV